MFNNVKILEFGDDFQIHHEECIEISTNMPSIGLEIPEIAWIFWIFCKSVEAQGYRVYPVI